jgi:hypothetical protein
VIGSHRHHDTQLTVWFLFALKVKKKRYRQKQNAAGGRWNPEKQLWFVQYGKIAGTQLEKHIQADENDNDGKPKKRLYVYTS